MRRLLEGSIYKRTASKKENMVKFKIGHTLF